MKELERAPLRTILQNFLNHVDSLETERLDGSYEKEFQELKYFSEILRTSKEYSCSEGEREVNRKKNRYKDILPFDNSRVILSEYAGVPGSDYINANYIKGASGSPAYIACQGPLPNTVNDFWRMVVECEVQVIVMACNEEEAGKHKCENYWVEQEGEEKQFGMVAIRLMKVSTVCPDFLIRTMRLKYANTQSPHVPEERTVCQFHYSAWPDHGVPPLVRPLLDMVRLVRDTQASETLPVLVHCSAGCGRTGTICAIDFVLGLLRAGKLNKDFSLYKLVQDMRKQRTAMVQTKEQYILVHQAVRELFREQLRMIDSHPYENIDVNGMPLVKQEETSSYSSPNVVVPAENSSEEKQVFEEKEIEIRIPPLPLKRRSRIATSKQEKEVENETERQRSLAEQSSISSPHKPRIAKLKALFERTSATREIRSSQSKQYNSQMVTRSHSLGAVRIRTDDQEQIGIKNDVNVKRITNQTVSCVGISTAQGSKPTIPIKRSKSLKTLGSNQHCKFSLATTTLNSNEGSSVHNLNSLMPNTTADSGLLSRYKVTSKIGPVALPQKIVRNMKINVGNSNFVSSTHIPIDRMGYEDSHVMPRRRRSMESITFEDISKFDERGFTGQNASLSLKSDILNDDDDEVLHNCKCDLVSNEQLLCRSNKLVQKETTHNLTVEAQKKVNAIVAGLGVRERRNSFRQAVGTSRGQEVKTNRRCRDYETIWPSANVIRFPNQNRVVKQGTCVDVPSDTNIGLNVTSSQVQNLKQNSSELFHAKSEQNDTDEKLPQLGERRPPPYVGNLSHLHGRYLEKSFYNTQTNSRNDKSKMLEEGMHSSDVQQSPRESRLRLLGEKKSLFKAQQNPRCDRPQQLRGGRPQQLRDKKPPNQKQECRGEKFLPSEIRGCKEGYIPREAIDSHQYTNTCISTSSNRGGQFCSRSKELFRNKTLTANKEFSLDTLDSNPGSNVDKNISTSDESSLLGQSLKVRQLTSQYDSTSQRPNCIGWRCRSAPAPVPSDLRNHPRRENSFYSAAEKDMRMGGCCHTNAASHGLGNVMNSRAGTSVCDGSSRLVNLKNNRRSTPFGQLNCSNEQQITYGLVAGIQLHRDSQDDVALCPNSSGGTEEEPSISSRVCRHASVVLLRRSLAETGGLSQMNSNLPQASLAIWNSSSQGYGDASAVQNTYIHNQESAGVSCDSWSEAPGIDVDSIAASISPHSGFTSEHIAPQPATLVKKQHYF